MPFSFQTAAACGLCLAGLSACQTVQSQNQLYQTFASTNAVTSPLVGRARNVSALTTVTSALKTQEVTGSIDHASGSTTIGSVTDASGLSANDVLVDDSLASGGLTVIEASLSPIQNNTLDFVRSYTVSGIFGAQQEGFYGIATLPSDMPTAPNATASYSGEASGFAPNGKWVGAPATVTADFGNGTVGISAAQTVGGIAGTILVTGATISGNTISGGTLTATQGGLAIDATSTSVHSFTPEIEGYFYGYDDTNNIPDEVGIEIGAIGSDGQVDLRVFAD